MLNNFKNEDFERFLKQSADGLRMRPSNKVWEKINQRMNRRRRGVIISSALFLITASLFGYYLVDASKSIGDPMAASNIIHKPLPPRTAPIPQLEPHTQKENKIVTTTTAQTEPQTGNTLPFTATAIAATPLALTPAADEQTAALENTTTNSFTPTLVDEYQPTEGTPISALAKGLEQNTDPDRLLTIESVVNSYKRRFKSPKTEWQFIFTPTVSYRRLTENKSFLRQVPSNSPLFANAAHYNVNNVVSHKPALGLELGMAFKYRVNNSVKLRSGLQLNISRYDIKVFNSYAPVLSTIALNSGNGVDSFNTITRFRNLNNSQSGDWLENMYLQVSAPIGAELKLFGNEQTHFGIATTVQPTYVISDRSYLISADYKTYTQVPSLTRRWNVHTALETYVGYSTGKLKWQIGPQVRYQLLSSFDTEYPVKENLFDFGLKVGVSLNKQ